MDKKASLVNIALPPDANTLLAAAQGGLGGTNCINLVIAPKQDLPQWLDLRAATDLYHTGAQHWEWASCPEVASGAKEPDVVVAACGATPTIEALAAVELLSAGGVAARVRVVNVCNPACLAHPDENSAGLSEKAFEAMFGAALPVIFAFHGYPSAIHHLVHRRPCPSRFHVHGYREEGTTTTPFDLLVVNEASRFHIALNTVRRLAAQSATDAAATDAWKQQLAKHHDIIRRDGVDPSAIAHWRWSGHAERGTAR